MRGRRIQIGLVSLILLVSPIIQVQSIDVTQESIYEGPFLERILFNIITQDDYLFTALDNNQIDLIGDILDPSLLDGLGPLHPELIDVVNSLRNGYGYMAFNCEKYPLNISQFRRAIAYAVDKMEITEAIWNGLAVPLDSLVPQNNPLSVEGDVPFSYYDQDNETAMAILDNLGFIDVNEDGYRELPNGTSFDVRIDYGTTSNIVKEISMMFEETLERIGINATAFPYDFYIYPQQYPSYFENFEMIFGGRSFPTFDLDWMACPNPPSSPLYNININWSNSTYDSWSSQLLSSTEYSDIAEATLEMQKIWLEECPYIVCYQNRLLYAHRNDKFTGFVNDVLKGVPSFWTNYKLRLDSGPLGQIGGTLRIGVPLYPDTYNLMTSSSTYSLKIFDILYDSLLKQSPDGSSIPWLAKNYTITTTEDDVAISEGHSRLTFDILDNATWSDGEPLTAEDISYSLSYYVNSVGNPLGQDLLGLVTTYAPNDYRVVVEFNTTSYWHLHSIGYKPIMPKQVLETIGLSEWQDWKPDPLSGEFVTSGPFNISDYVENEYVELTRNPAYFYQPHAVEATDTSPTETAGIWDTTNLIPIALVGFVALVIVLVVCRRNR
ncbi:MAG: ABC transporter substrate-binding protein [Candidatus Thorarchaeota archaeon]